MASTEKDPEPRKKSVSAKSTDEGIKLIVEDAKTNINSRNFRSISCMFFFLFVGD